MSPITASKLASITTLLFSLLTVCSLTAQAVKVRIISPNSYYTSHDPTVVATDLQGMLNASPAYLGSVATASVTSGVSLMDSYYRPDYRVATRAVLDTKHDYLVMMPETEFLADYPEATFEGVLQMSRRALSAGSTPLLLMPRGTQTLSTLGTNAYRIAHGCGIQTIPGGYAVETAGLTSPSTTLNTRRQAYLLAAKLFSKITGLNASSTSYLPSHEGSPLDVVNLAGIAVSTLSTHASTSHYTTSRHLDGAIRYRTITPPNNTVRYALTGTSTEHGIRDYINPIIEASGFVAANHATWGSQDWDAGTSANHQALFNTYPNEFLFNYARRLSVTAQSLINSQQSNLQPTVYDRHNDAIGNGAASMDNVIASIHWRINDMSNAYKSWGWRSVPNHIGVARLHDLNPAIHYTSDGVHMTGEVYSTVAAMMLTSALGQEITAPSWILSSPTLSQGFNTGKETLKQLAFLSETKEFAPESSLAISTPHQFVQLPDQVFTINFAATGGTPPYSWAELSTNGLPASFSLSPSGVLTGTVTGALQTRQLVIKVTDSLGSIRKVPVSIDVLNPAATLTIAENANLTSAGNLGGPFSPSTANYTVKNFGNTPLNWTASKTATWLNLSSTSGTLAAGESATVVASINPTATSLAAGNYTDTITFTNTTNGTGNTTRSASLSINTIPVANAGPDQTVILDASPWTPAQITPLAWYDANDASTITHSSGAVSQWSSKSGSSHMLQANAAQRPTTGIAQINGLNAIAFDGADDGLQTATNPFGSTISNASFFAVTNIGTISNSTMFSLSGGGDRWNAHSPWSDGNIYFDCGGTGTPNRISGASGWTAGQNKLLTFYCSSSQNFQYVMEGGNYKIYDFNGHIVNTASGMILGNDGGGAFDNCSFGEVVILNGVENSSNRTKLEGYLAHKWGLTATLPEWHSYYQNTPIRGSIANFIGSASDADNNPLTTTWAFVSGPDYIGISNANTLNASATFTIPGTYTFRLTVSDGLSTSSDQVVIVVTTPYANWATGSFANPFTLTGAMDDSDSDGLKNLLEFAFGTDPTLQSLWPMNFVSLGEVTTPGSPKLMKIPETGPTSAHHAVFARRRDHIAANLKYSVLFSADLATWTPSDAGQTVLTNPNSTAAFQAVSQPFPASVPLQAGGTATPTFFRVAVTQKDFTQAPEEEE